MLRWDSVYDGDHGALAAIDKLQLDVLALPGATLPPDFQITGRTDIMKSARRAGTSLKASYKSIAVFWKVNSELQVDVLDERGSYRIMWLRVFDGVLECLLGFVYRPAAGDASAEMKWRGDAGVER